MPSRWDTANRGWRRRVFHYPPPTLLSGNFRLPCAIELQPFSLTPLKMRKVQVRLSRDLFHSRIQRPDLDPRQSGSQRTKRTY